MSLTNLLLGRPLATREEGAERIGPATGIPIFGLDALSSAAYGPEAALTLLIPLGAAGIGYIVPITASIIILLTIVYFSYCQTIDAYPGGGGSYTVAHENLGSFAGLLAASALMIDYILVVAVGISAGVGALVSALPAWQPHTLALCLGILVVITLVNLRGVRDTGLIFLVPTYLFLGCLVVAILAGFAKAIGNGGHPVPVVAPPTPHTVAAGTAAASAWLLLKVFSSGCTAMTGVEAVSNGVKAFREPTAKNAKRSLTVIIALLIILLAGIAWLVRAYGIVATDPGAPGYDSVLSMLIAAVAGRGAFYYVSIASILLVLALSANTAFADFPRLCRSIAFDRYLPHSFATSGRRLIYSQGVYFLAGAAAVLLIIFGGITDNLIPLFAIGAFLAFTLSQAGMVAHWRRVRGPGSGRSMLLNGLGATATAITVVVVLVAKFAEGAWITLLLIPSLLIFMKWVRRHYQRVGDEIASTQPLDLVGVHAPIVVVPVDRWSEVARHGLRFALSVSPDVIGLHVSSGAGEQTDDLEKNWCKFVETPVVDLGLSMPRLAVVESPYRFVVNPILEYVLELERTNPDREIAVMIPEMVERRWYYSLLHNQRGSLLKALLYLKGSRRIIVINAPWYLKC
jgi:amino acid transporter